MKYYAPIAHDDMKTLTDLLNEYHISYELRASDGILIEQSGLRKLSPSALKRFADLKVVPEPEGALIILDEADARERNNGAFLGAVILIIALSVISWLNK